MRSKIFRSTVVVAVTVLLCSLAVIMGVLYSYFDRVQSHQLRDELSLAVIGTEHSGTSFLEDASSDRFRLTWVAADGTVLWGTHADAVTMENHADRQEIQAALAGGSGSSSRYSQTLTERTMYAAQRLSDGTVLRISVSQATPAALALGMLLPILFVAAISVVLCALLAKHVSRRITQPLNRLDLEHPLENNTYEELTPLLERIDQQMQTRREFSANVSHELKTPLQSIIGSAELLENGLVQPADTPRFVGYIRKEAARLVALVEDIIRLSRLDEGMELPKEEVELYSLAQEVLTVLSPAARERNITCQLTGTCCALTGVRGLVQQILYNLCDNAIKYNTPGGSVTVNIGTQNGRPCLQVRDTGIGIPKEHQDRIFERFYRVDKSHSRLSGGTGLGLSIVKHAAVCHNARIELESTPGEGTIVTVIF